MTDAQSKELVNTVENNLSRYSERDYSRSLEARKLQYKLLMPSHRHPIKNLDNKTQMENCPLNCNNIKVVEVIWWENLGCLAVNTPHKKTPHIRSTLIPIPMTVLQCYRAVTLAVDVMYVIGIHFINTISHNINSMTAEHITSAEASTL